MYIAGNYFIQFFITCSRTLIVLVISEISVRSLNEYKCSVQSMQRHQSEAASQSINKKCTVNLRKNFVGF